MRKYRVMSIFVAMLIIFSTCVFAAQMHDNNNSKDQSVFGVIEDFWNLIREPTTKSNNNGGDNGEVDVPTPPTTPPTTTPTTAPTTANSYEPVYPNPEDDDPPVYVEPTTAPTTQNTTEEESTDYEGRLSELLTADNNQGIIIRNEEVKTLAPLVTQPAATVEQTSGPITWEMAAIFGCAFVFIVLLALLIALVLQKRRMEEGQVGVTSDTRSTDRHKSARKGRTKRNESDEIKFDYGDPLVRKYMDSPSPRQVRRDIEEINPENVASSIRAAAVSNRIEREYPGIDHSIFTDTKVGRQDYSAVDESLSTEDVLRQTDHLLESLNSKYGLDNEKNNNENEDTPSLSALDKDDVNTDESNVVDGTDDDLDAGIDIDFDKYLDDDKKTDIPILKPEFDDE